MPIYAYRCAECGFQNDYLRKVSDPVLSECPNCGKASFTKQITAAGFQLKGSGWYATDFKGAAKPVAAATTEGKSDTKAESKPAETAAAPAACGTGCACH